MADLELIEELCRLTGLPQHLVLNELTKLLQKSGRNVDQVSIEDIREVLAEYLQDVLIEAKKAHSL